MKKRFLLLTLLSVFFAGNSFARIYIPIDQPSDKKVPIAIKPLIPLGSGVGKGAEEIPAIIQKDLEITAYFEFIPPLAFLEPANSTALTTETINFDQWTAIEIQALIKGSIAKNGNQISVQLKLFDPFLKTVLVGKQYDGTAGEMRTIAHRFADEVLLALTGTRGPFSSRISYSALTRNANKAIYIMDADGENNYRISKDKSVDIGPAWSPDGSKIAYTSYARGNPDIYIADLSSGELKQLTDNHAMNLTPTFTNDGQNILFTSSVSDDPEIWLMDLQGKMIRQVTHSRGIDISPDFGPDGNQFVFSSERAGKLHVFKSSLDGSVEQRLTFVGQYNDTPSWSPDGTRLVFCGQDRGNFDIFIMNPDGTMIQRLTAGDGNNEHPTWSPDGRFITFSSTRTGGPAIYIMRWDGANPTRVSKGNGILPEWGPYLH